MWSWGAHIAYTTKSRMTLSTHSQTKESQLWSYDCCLMSCEPDQNKGAAAPVVQGTHCGQASLVRGTQTWERQEERQKKKRI